MSERTSFSDIMVMMIVGVPIGLTIAASVLGKGVEAALGYLVKWKILVMSETVVTFPGSSAGLDMPRLVVLVGAVVLLLSFLGQKRQER